MLLVVLSTYCFFDVPVAAAVVGSTFPKGRRFSLRWSKYRQYSFGTNNLTIKN